METEPAANYYCLWGNSPKSIPKEDEEDSDVDSDAVRSALRDLDALIKAMNLAPDNLDRFGGESSAQKIQIVSSPPPGFEKKYPWPWISSVNPTSTTNYYLFSNAGSPGSHTTTTNYEQQQQLFPLSSPVLWEKKSISIPDIPTLLPPIPSSLYSPRIPSNSTATLHKNNVRGVNHMNLISVIGNPTLPDQPRLLKGQQGQGSSSGSSSSVQYKMRLRGCSRK